MYRQVKQGIQISKLFNIQKPCRILPSGLVSVMKYAYLFHFILHILRSIIHLMINLKNWELAGNSEKQANCHFIERGKLAVNSQKEAHRLSIKRKSKSTSRDYSPNFCFLNKKRERQQDVEGTLFSFFFRERLGA